MERSCCSSSFVRLFGVALDQLEVSDIKKHCINILGKNDYLSLHNALISSREKIFDVYSDAHQPK